MKTNIKGYHIYKAMSSLKGSVLQLNPAHDLSCIWLEIAKQLDDKHFDFDNKIIFKLGETDILQLIYTMEIINFPIYRELLSNSDSADFDAYMKDLMPPKLKDKGALLELFHKDKRNGNISIMTVKPNAGKYGGGFYITISKTANGENKSYSIGICPYEALGTLFCLKKCAATIQKRSYEDEEE